MNSSLYQSIKGKHETICPTAKVRLKLGHITEQLFEAHLQISMKMVENATVGY